MPELVQAGKVWIEMDNVEKLIVPTIKRYGIRWLVMGAAAEKQYSKSASISSHVQSIVVLPPLTSARECDHVVDADEDISSCQYLNHPTSAKENVFDTLNSTSLLMDDMRGDSSPLPSPHKSQDPLFQSSSVTFLAEGSQGQSSCDLHDKLEHAVIDAENLKRKAFEESVRRWKAEEDVKDVLQKVEASESLYTKEITQRKEMEEMLEKQRQEIKRMKNRRDQFIEELQTVRDQTPTLESQITKSHGMEKELEERIIQAVNLLITFKESRDELQAEHDNARREINKLRKLVEEDDTMSFRRPQFFTSSFMEIFEATQNFDPSLKIGEGRCGSVYKGLIRNVRVAIKMLPSLGSRGDSVFEYEAEVLSRVRHPNLIILIGICPESRSLIYEYLENGSLEDRISCQGKTPPLPWHTRIKIAIEMCSALIFLHSSIPRIVHGNLKLTNVLLDANYVCKLSDLGIHRLILCKDRTSNTSLCNNIDPEVSAYIDPEFLETGELTAYSDIYSFGVVLLRILTGRPASKVINDVKCALERENFGTVLDLSAGDWPLEQAKQLAYLALQCCEKNPLNRPDLVSDVWTAIESMRDLFTTSHVESEGHRCIPSHFVCPIFQEVMTDPYIAADGFTYEADAIKGWLNSGHKTSPMTNLKLEHCDLLPNYTLYYAIQDWQQQS